MNLLGSIPSGLSFFNTFLGFLKQYFLFALFFITSISNLNTTLQHKHHPAAHPAGIPRWSPIWPLYIPPHYQVITNWRSVFFMSTTQKLLFCKKVVTSMTTLHHTLSPHHIPLSQPLSYHASSPSQPLFNGTYQRFIATKHRGERLIASSKFYTFPPQQINHFSSLRKILTLTFQPHPPHMKGLDW